MADDLLKLLEQGDGARFRRALPETRLRGISAGRYGAVYEAVIDGELYAVKITELLQEHLNQAVEEICVLRLLSERQFAPKLHGTYTAFGTEVREMLGDAGIQFARAREHNIDPLAEYQVIVQELLARPLAALYYNDTHQRMRSHAGTVRWRQRMQQMLLMLREMHADGIVHGDLHENNVMLSHSGEVRLIDFGFAYNYGPPAQLSADDREKLAVEIRNDVEKVRDIIWRLADVVPAHPLAATNSQYRREVMDCTSIDQLLACRALTGPLPSESEYDAILYAASRALRARETQLPESGAGRPAQRQRLGGEALEGLFGIVRESE